MVHIPPSNMKAQMKRERVDKTDRHKQIESIRHTVESTIKNALARKRMNGQPFAFSVDSEGNVHAIQSSAPDNEAQTAGSSMQDLDTTMDQAEDFADDELFGQPMIIAKGKRINRSNRDRGRSTVRRNTASKSACPYSQPTAVSTPDSDPEPPIPPRKQHKTFMIQDEQAVKDFLHGRLKGMQQLADKKIAKAWIKSICPKKQANFPYQNKKLGRDGHMNEQPAVPGWWPGQNVCRFIEPDHIKRTERMELCLHLLRLRPDPDQLKIWNKDKTEPNSTHLYHGWTAFLKESAGAEIFDELPKEDKVRTESRKAMMEQMYRVAQLEQDFLDGAIDGDTQYSYEEDQEERKTAPVKRTRTMSVDSCAEGQSRQSSASVSCTRAKRARQTTPSNTPTLVPGQVQPQKGESNLPKSRPQEHIQVEEQSDEGFFDFPQADAGYDLAMGDNLCSSETESQSRRSNPFIGQCGVVDLKRESSLEPHHRFRPQPQPHQQRWVDFEQEPMQWTVPPQPASSFMLGREEYISGPDSYQLQQPATAKFPGRQDWNFPPYPAQEMVQVQQVNQVAEPQFQAVPDTSIYSPQRMGPLPLSNYVQYNGHLPQEQAHATTMAPNQFFMPATEAGVADFHPPMPAAPQQIYQEPAQSQPQYHHHHQPRQGLAQRHIAPMHYHGLPYAQPNGWPQPQ
ncbi:hypothetical protein DOTSEDRAFT_72529 [Dothistroma septosporum NZE10]|uniref:Subtelomeric hrmA-associated cluster protein AFUB-079030/YDR124W-like helical bundle domain-containing protein n=1 Tax=Dothistroma septosporum (strain NZE10 / CBS 128990) TaxID=675120 RepID=M2YML5_DOTSN|nr:hypothetical protein DOTSEDRAFT_72529 [Dothistroma septosporum NZE10]